MNARIRLIAGLFSVLAAGSAVAATCPAGPVAHATNQVSGHYFEVYKADGIAWVDAKACAEAATYGVISGHLATITSSDEELFVDGLRDGAVGSPSYPSSDYKGEVWLGGFQDPAALEPGGGWRWLNKEGPFPGASTNSGPVYTDWNVNEPNNSVPGESHLALGRYGLGGGWNDEDAALNLIGGYIVEYDVPRPAACDPTLGTCQTIQGQTLQFPPGSFGPTDTIQFTSYEFTDPRVAAGTCGHADSLPLVLFTDAAFEGKILSIPPYLCGSPKFVVVAIQDNLDIQQGTVLVKNNSIPNQPVLPGNGAYNNCNDPIVPLSDPQVQDVVVWQSKDASRMLEADPSVGGVGQFAGAAGEFTDKCGSSEAKTKGASYFVVGLHIDFGQDYTWTLHPDTNHERFVALTLYKLSLLQTAVANAKADGALKNGDATKMTAQLDNAVKKLGRGDASGALGHVNQFLKFVDAAKYTVVRYQPVPPETVGMAKNYNGEHVMRGTNIEFMLRVKVIPYGP